MQRFISLKPHCLPCISFFCLLIFCGNLAADPNCTNLGKLYYVGSDGSSSIWLSVSKAQIKEAQLQGPAGQIVDDFSMSPNELHLSDSPFIGTGASGVHTLYNIKNNGGPCFIDSALQSGSPPEFPDLPDPPDGGGPPEGEIPPELGNGNGGGGNSGSGSGTGNGGLGDGSGSGGAIGVASGGFSGGSGGNVLSQIVWNVNKNFLTNYLLHSYSVTERIDNAFLRCDPEILQQPWQFWAEPRYAGLKSHIATGNPKMHSRNLQMGASYNITPGFLVGLSVVGNDSNLSTFSGSLVNSNRGMLVGPYAGLMFNNIILDSWLIYGHSVTTSNLITLKGKFLTNSYMASANASALFDFCACMFQPKLSVFYDHSKTNRFNYIGMIPNRSINIIMRVGANKFDYARGSLTGKLFKDITLGCVTLIPSVLAGVNNNFVLPDHKRYLNSNLQVVSRTPWSGVVQTGMGIKLNKVLRVDLLGGYYSIGTKEDLWDLRCALTMDI